MSLNELTNEFINLKFVEGNDKTGVSTLQQFCHHHIRGYDGDVMHEPLQETKSHAKILQQQKKCSYLESILYHKK